MGQTVICQSNSQTKAGQYMCAECGKIFDVKKEVNSHIQTMHEPFLRTA
ncbi:MAG: hypothetical protein ACXV2C_08160 [Candidatus Bathyarchaeia archaeon]